MSVKSLSIFFFSCYARYHRKKKYPLGGGVVTREGLAAASCGMRPTRALIIDTKYQCIDIAPASVKTCSRCRREIHRRDIGSADVCADVVE